jgi:hypothetical protein
MDRVERVMRDYGMSISKTGPEVIRFQIRLVREDGLRSLALSKQTENKFDGDAHAPNDGLATKNLGIHCYASKKCLVDHGFRFYVRANILFVRTLSRLPLRRSVEIVTKIDRAVGRHVLPSVCG